MRLAHVRERHAPAGFRGGWRRRLTPATPRSAGSTSRSPGGAPLRPDRARPQRAAFRRPIATLDDLLAAGLRVEALAGGARALRSRGEADEDEAVLDGADLAFGPPILPPPSLRDFYAFERHVGTMWGRRGTRSPRRGSGCRSSTSATPRRSAARTIPSGRREARRARLRAGGSGPHRHAGPRSRLGRAEEAIGGYMILNDWSARDLQREETTVRLGPAKGKDFASRDRAVAGHARRARRPSRWHRLRPRDDRDRQRSRDQPRLVVRAPLLVRRRCWPAPRPTSGSGPATWWAAGRSAAAASSRSARRRIGRYLEPGDEVVLRIERLGELRTPIVARP